METDILHRADAAGFALQQAAADRKMLGQSLHLQHVHATASCTTLSAWKQDAPSRPAGTGDGAVVSHLPTIISWQRGWNAQPVGRAPGCGTVPPIVASRARGTARMFGTERSSALV